MEVLDYKKIIFDNGDVRYVKKCCIPDLYDPTLRITAPESERKLPSTIVCVLNEENEWEILSKNDGTVISKFLEPYKLKGPGIFSVKNSVNGLIGVIDNNGKEVIPCNFSYIEISQIGIKVQNANFKYAFFSTKGVQLTPFQYDFISYINVVPEIFEEFAIDYDYDLIVSMDGKEGVLNCRDGIKEILPTRFLEVRQFTSDSYLVRLDSGYGLFKRNGKQFIPCRYDSIEYGIFDIMKEQLIDIIVEKEGQFGIRNFKTGKFVEEIIHDSIKAITHYSILKGYTYSYDIKN